MEKERNYLMQHVFPRLVHLAAKRHVSVSPLDLRWGISKESAERGEVVKTCLREIQNTHPFFIGILGSRYGWTPSLKEISIDSETLQEFPWLKDDVRNGLSMTEIEMQFGVLREKETVNAYFYYKPFSHESNNKQVELITAIRNDSRYELKEYSDEVKLGELVERDFLQLLDMLYPINQLDEFHEIYNEQEHLISELSEGFVGRDLELNQIDQFVYSRNENALAICASKGIGKSSILATWIKYHKFDNTIISYFPTQLAGDKDAPKIQQYILDRLSQISGKQYNIKSNIYDAIKDAIDEISCNTPLLIIVDAVDTISINQEIDKNLSWLPLANDKCKVIVSYSDDIFDDVISRRGFKCLQVNALRDTIKLELINNYLKPFGKSEGLTDDDRNRIASNNKSNNLHLMYMALNEMVYNCTIDNLPTYVDSYTSAHNSYEFKKDVVMRMLKKYNKLFLAKILSPILYSRKGLTELDILAISSVSQLEWSQFYCAYSFVFDYNNGVFNILDKEFKQILLDRLISSDDESTAIEGICKYYKEQLEELKKEDNRPSVDDLMSYFKIEFFKKEVSNEDIGNYTRNWIMSEKMFKGKERLFEELAFQYNRKDLKLLFNLLKDPVINVYFQRNHEDELYLYWKAIHDHSIGDFKCLIDLKNEEYYTHEFLSDYFYTLSVFSENGLSDREFATKCIIKSIEYLQQSNPWYKKFLSAQRLIHLSALCGDTNVLLKYVDLSSENTPYELECKVSLILNCADKYEQDGCFEQAISIIEKYKVHELISRLGFLSRTSLESHVNSILADAYAQIGFNEQNLLLAHEYYKKSLSGIELLIKVDFIKYFERYIKVNHNYAIFCFEIGHTDQSIQVLKNVIDRFNKEKCKIKPSDWSLYIRLMVTYGSILTDKSEASNANDLLIEANNILQYALNAAKGLYEENVDSEALLYADSLYNLSRTIRRLATSEIQLKEALSYCEIASIVYGKIANIKGVVNSLSSQGLILQTLGNFDSAADRFRLAVVKLESVCDNNVNIQKLEILLKKALECLVETNDVSGIILIAKKLIVFYYRLFNSTQDERYLEASMLYNNFLEQNNTVFPRSEWSKQIHQL